MPDRWEYCYFNVADGEVMETLARQGVEGWEAFHIFFYQNADNCDEMVRIYCKRRI